MCFTFKKNNKQTKKSVNCFLQDDGKCRYTVSADLYWNKTAKTHGTDYKLLENSTGSYSMYILGSLLNSTGIDMGTVSAYVMWLWLSTLLMCTLKWLSCIEIQSHKGFRIKPKAAATNLTLKFYHLSVIDTNIMGEIWLKTEQPSDPI